MADLDLKCRCEKVQGRAVNVTPSNGNRAVCCCSDCQAFATHLGKAEDTLDEFGGTEIYQTTPSKLKITQGQDQLRCLRLREKGLLRWYADCCKTPVANTINANFAFVGLIHSFMDEPNPEAIIGPVRAYVQTQHAKGEPTYPKHHPKFPLGINLRIMRQLLIWRLQGKHKPSAFFDEEGRPISKPVIVNHLGSVDN